MHIIATIKNILETKKVGANGFETRDIHVTTEEQYPQILLIQFVQGAVVLPDAFKVGQKVRIDVNLKGREWTNPQGEVQVFNSIQGWKITEEK